MSDDRLRDATTRASQARELLENEMLQEAFSTLETDYMRLWRNTKAADSDAREKIFLAVNVVGKVKEHLDRVIDSGKLAQHELNELIAQQEKRRFFR